MAVVTGLVAANRPPDVEDLVAQCRADLAFLDDIYGPDAALGDWERSYEVGDCMSAASAETTDDESRPSCADIYDDHFDEPGFLRSYFIDACTPARGSGSDGRTECGDQYDDVLAGSGIDRDEFVDECGRP